uniref:Uncharacterized protein n=1 Tax=Arundo donax TaxID=35708 RepID=A0A0A9EHN7_ARUDO
MYGCAPAQNRPTRPSINHSLTKAPDKIPSSINPEKA